MTSPNISTERRAHPRDFWRCKLSAVIRSLPDMSASRMLTERMFASALHLAIAFSLSNVLPKFLPPSTRQSLPFICICSQRLAIAYRDLLHLFSAETLWLYGWPLWGINLSYYWLHWLLWWQLPRSPHSLATRGGMLGIVAGSLGTTPHVAVQQSTPHRRPGACTKLHHAHGVAHHLSWVLQRLQPVMATNYVKVHLCSLNSWLLRRSVVKVDHAKSLRVLTHLCVFVSNVSPVRKQGWYHSLRWCHS